MKRRTSPTYRARQTTFGMDALRAHMGTRQTHVIPDGNIYRVEIDKHTGEVTVMHTFLDTKLDGTYASVADLPKWMRDKLASLSIMSFEPPTYPVAGVGQRISEFVFWVYK